MSGLRLVVNDHFTEFQPRGNEGVGGLKKGDKVIINARHYRERGAYSARPGIGILTGIDREGRQYTVTVNGCQANYLMDYVSTPYLNLIKGGKETTSVERLKEQMRKAIDRERKLKKELAKQDIKRKIRETPHRW